MPLLSDIQRMQAEGRTDQEIISSLKEQGISPREITEALTQSKIKEAVSAPAEGGYETSAPSPEQQMSVPEQSQAAPAEAYAPSQAQEGAYPAAGAYPAPAEGAAYSEYPQYPQQAQMGGISPDTITEISEQVVAEKLSPIRRDLEKVIDIKTTLESKTEYLDERLKRIEKIIDRLQLSIMQKVGDYMTNIDDIKKEIVETQKSFKALAPEGLKEKSRKQKEVQEQE
jgi:DNA-binding transcriptional MerR regulator